MAARKALPTSAPDVSNSDLKAGSVEPGQDAKAVSGPPAKDTGGPPDVFLLERLFPEPHEAFHAGSTPEPNSNCIVALDTNALLLPYSVAKDDLTNLGQVYSKIANEDRLFLPERVAREFIKNRDRKLADMVQTISDLKSRINIGDARISPLLDGLAENEALTKASEKLIAAKKAYVSALNGLLSQIKSWRGNDPVTSLYATIFKKDRLARPLDCNEKLEKNWKYRVRNKIPPGYKDGAKDDLGIGDFAIWMSLLNLGTTHKKDLIFVTGEEKADWFVRSGGERLYPRPELVDEYRRFSGGRTIRLSSLHELLREMAAPAGLVNDVAAAELRANSKIIANTVVIRATLPPPQAMFKVETKSPQSVPPYPGISEYWLAPPCNASPDGRHDFHQGLALLRGPRGLTYQGPCSRCGLLIDTGEQPD